jgi:putative membrane protein
MKLQFSIGYVLGILLLLWSLFASNMEFFFYGVITAALIAFLHATDKKFSYSSFALWGFNIWVLLHILGGLFPIDGGVLYSYMLIPLIDAPYSVLKYDQIVHAYCYFVIALLMWDVVKKYADKNASKFALGVIAALAAGGIGGFNEIIEFIATVSIENVNVGGYENTAIDIIANTIGAFGAIPFMKNSSEDLRG